MHFKELVMIYAPAGAQPLLDCHYCDNLSSNLATARLCSLTFNEPYAHKSETH